MQCAVCFICFQCAHHVGMCTPGDTGFEGMPGWELSGNAVNKNRHLQVNKCSLLLETAHGCQGRSYLKNQKSGPGREESVDVAKSNRCYQK